MATADITSVDPLLMDQIIETVPSLVYRNVGFLGRMKNRKAVLTGGRRVLFPFRSGSPQGVGARLGTSGNPTLPTAGRSQFLQPEITVAYLYSRMGMSGPAMAALDREAISKMVTREFTEQMNTFLQDCSRQMYGNGNGALAVVDTTNGVPGHTISVALQERDIVPAFPLLGARVDMISVADDLTKVFSDRTIDGVAISGTSMVLTISGANITSTDGDYLVREGTKDGTTVGCAEFIGLNGICDSANPTARNYGGLDRTSAVYGALWQAVELTAAVPGTTTLTQALLDSLAETVEYRGGNVNLFIMPPRQMRQLIQAQASKQQYTNITKGKTDFGFKAEAIDISGRSHVEDPACTPGTVYAIQEEDWELRQTGEPHWRKGDINYWKILEGSDGYEATIMWYMTPICTLPYKQAKLTSLSIAA